MNQEEIKVYKEKPNGFIPLVGVAAIYVNVKGRLLFLQREKGKSESGKWGVPAGKVERNESPEDAAKRELFEETGIDSLVSKRIGDLYLSKPNLNYVYHAFCLILDHTPSVVLSSEHSSYQWVSVSEAYALPLMLGASEALNFYVEWSCI